MDPFLFSRGLKEQLHYPKMVILWSNLYVSQNLKVSCSKMIVSHIKWRIKLCSWISSDLERYSQEYLRNRRFHRRVFVAWNLSYKILMGFLDPFTPANKTRAIYTCVRADSMHSQVDKLWKPQMQRGKSWMKRQRRAEIVSYEHWCLW